MQLYHTIRHLRARQVWYRIVRPFQRSQYKDVVPPAKAIEYALNFPVTSLFSYAPADRFDSTGQTFSFLNLSRSYPSGINWNDKSHGLLWSYHLNYFGWLEDEQLSVTDRQKTIDSYTSANKDLKVGLAPYPTSLRSISRIRFFIKHGPPGKETISLLYQHLHRLYTFPEYELDGNHLWENGCSLIVGGIYVNEASFFNKGLNILLSTIKDQISKDGMHIEGSPMYHSLLLLRLLHCIEIWEILPPKFGHPADLELFRQKAGLMLGWLEHITFSNGQWPMFNDAAPGIAPSTAVLKEYAYQLNIQSRQPISDRPAYKVYRSNYFELMVDISGIMPDWQPGHSHADTFTFCLNASGKSLIVDTGISTYQPDNRRQYERSTAAHNTITINDKSSSDTWRSFRVGRRAQVTMLEEKSNFVNLAHNGYKARGVKHIRSIIFAPDRIIIEDRIERKSQKAVAVLHLHFHPETILKKYSAGKYGINGTMIVIDGAKSIHIEDYKYCAGFNKLVLAQRLRIEVSELIKTTIERTNYTC